MTVEDMIDILPPPGPLKLKEVITIIGGTPPSSAMFIEKSPRLEMECVDMWNWKRGPSFFGSGGEPWAYLVLSKQSVGKESLLSNLSLEYMTRSVVNRP